MAAEIVFLLREWAEGEGEQEQYEFPDVDGCIPPSMKLKPLSVRQLQQLVGSIGDQADARVYPNGIEASLCKCGRHDTAGETFARAEKLVLETRREFARRCNAAQEEIKLLEFGLKRKAEGFV